jgi:hypothetical protein
MKKTILLLVALVGLAYYLHWFTFTTDGTGTTQHINVTLDKTKIEQDEAKALHVLKDEEQRIQQDASQAPAQGNLSAQYPQSQVPGADPDRYQQRTGGPNVSSAAQGGYDPYDTSTAPRGNGRNNPQRSVKRAPPSELDRGFE